MLRLSLPFLQSVSASLYLLTNPSKPVFRRNHSAGSHQPLLSSAALDCLCRRFPVSCSYAPDHHRSHPAGQHSRLRPCRSNAAAQRRFSRATRTSRHPHPGRLIAGSYRRLDRLDLAGYSSAGQAHWATGSYRGRHLGLDCYGQGSQQPGFAGTACSACRRPR